ncbi:protein yellow-like [Cimex lectularius]|uniref:Bee-milk protein n=1 Tax=Cimex lectularius TaxID=79782 RepID=A0A8I6SKB6_CIMLE|nr:protein yellow-like [Cimex lectularius]
MDVIHSWRNVDFNFPSSSTRDAMLRTGKFIPKNIAIIDVDVWEGFNGGAQKIFVTMPRLKPGTPATLASVGLTGILSPYPDWGWHREGYCDGITSVFRVEVDQCGRLWVLDSGTIDIFESQPKMICPPQILVFNMNDDTLIGRYRFPDDVIDPKSLLVTIVVDTRDATCENTFAYIADVVSYKLIVFDGRHQKSWRVSNNYFYPYPLHGAFEIAGVTFDLMDGILGLALGPMYAGDRRLYFHSLASVRESWVATSVLRNSSLFTDGNGSPSSFHVSQYTRPSQSAAQAMTKSGILFFGLLSQNAIACWNSKLSYTKDNIITVAQNNETLQFASGIKIRNGRVWALTSKLQNFIKGAVLETGENYRILTEKIENLTKGTKCRPTELESSPSEQLFNNYRSSARFSQYSTYKQNHH